MTHRFRRWALIATLGALSVLAGCATPTRPDPLEPFNRAMYEINEPIDKNLVEPFIKAPAVHVEADPDGGLQRLQQHR